MKVAICISGHLRQFAKGYANLCKNIVSVNPNCYFDFFIETWETQDWRTVKMFESTENIIDKVSLLYSPVSMNVEKDIEWDTSKYMKFVSNERWLKKGFGGARSKGQHILGMYYKIKKCNDQKSKYEKENNFTYDVVIRHRTDLGFASPILIDEKIDYMDNIVYVPNCDRAAKNGGIPIRDIFAISNSKNIDYYSSVFDNIDTIVEESKIFRPEPILNFHLNKNKSISVSELENDWFLIRDS
jgi:hypothetical protein